MQDRVGRLVAGEGAQGVGGTPAEVRVSFLEEEAYKLSPRG